MATFGRICATMFASLLVLVTATSIVATFDAGRSATIMTGFLGGIVCSVAYELIWDCSGKPERSRQ